MKCPHCKRLILSDAQLAVVRQAKRPVPIVVLAFTYGGYRPSMSYLSCRRAVERLVKMGVLRRVRPGVYQCKTQKI
jgi:hypothetical protein